MDRRPDDLEPARAGQSDGPALAALVHRLTLAPPDLFEPFVSASALVADVAVWLDGTVLDRPTLRALDADLAGAGRPRLAPGARRPRLLARRRPGGARHPGVRAAAAGAGGLSGWFLRVVEGVQRVLAGQRPEREWVQADDAPRGAGPGVLPARRGAARGRACRDRRRPLARGQLGVPAQGRAGDGRRGRARGGARPGPGRAEGEGGGGAVCELLTSEPASRTRRWASTRPWARSR